MKTEKEKMIAGELYNAFDPELISDRCNCRFLLKEFNDSKPDETELRQNTLKKLIGTQGNNLLIEPPFYCDYGSNITVGNNVYFNFNCVVLDVAPVIIGDSVLFAPNVQIYTATHPLDWEQRSQGLEYAKMIIIGSHVWVGGGAIICPGVQIGDRTVIGAGSVVTKDIPTDVVAAGNPCKIIRTLTH
ncbi:sugar O-acetyltransferase [Aphanothece hegewaldii CCALA 016]|uniref:Acetyltransferase n=1 Tax=Aphanothece hegewaldii CCALA 016 TaxID=2107694 RepID=A0A2T1LT58_9CHRO|nr:sugar O-acetyltransferase [Aphanothece hegewaldii]PSF33623.1 sugar O-acetyltransferase [Aphanothece hegewaldii CCALA 016]